MVASCCEGAKSGIQVISKNGQSSEPQNNLPTPETVNFCKASGLFAAFPPTELNTLEFKITLCLQLFLSCLSKKVKSEEEDHVKSEKNTRLDTNSLSPV